jgi:hypothetical protein
MLILVGRNFAAGLNVLSESSKVMAGNGRKLAGDNQTEPNGTG